MHRFEPIARRFLVNSVLYSRHMIVDISGTERTDIYNPRYTEEKDQLVPLADNTLVHPTPAAASARKDPVAHTSLHYALTTTICAAVSLHAAWHSLQRSRCRLQRSLRPFASLYSG